MRFFATIWVLVSMAAHAQSWLELKSQIKAESDKNKRAIQNARSAWPNEFFDGDNHFLMTEVNPSGKPIYLTTLNANAAITTGAAKLQTGSTGFILNGTNQHIFQWDAGAVLSHVEFDNRIAVNETSTTDRHATHIAGTLIASGINAPARGMAPQAQVHAYYFDNDILEIASQSETNQYGFMISNHSYGATTGWHWISGQWQWFGDESISTDEDYKAGFYSAIPKQLDQIAYLSPYHTMVWAAGNDRADVGNGTHPPDCYGGTGYDCIIQQGTAKNLITVGAVDQVLDYTGPASVAMPGFGSWGPTDDGRIKPDLVSDGASVFSTTNTGVDHYTTLGGTSMATATVSGALLLLQELQGKLNGGKPMRASTLKALAIHTTKETGTSPGPDYSFGWGLLDVDAAARVLSRHDDINTFIIEGTLSNEEVHTWTLTPQANQKITVTLVWNDPAGSPAPASLDPTTKMLVNDLDLRLSDNNGTIYPWILDPGNPSAGATQGDNTRDNVEKIEFTIPEMKPYALQLSHKLFLMNDVQDYSLIITYTSTNPSKTLYWVGGSGNWNDPTHWSLNSGGNPSGVVPGPNDFVIVDENSFTGIGDIQLTADDNCQTLRWFNSKDAGINFNGNTLTVNKELTLASASFHKSGNGKFSLSTTTQGSLNATTNFASRPNIDVATGNWTVNGNLYVDSLAILGGSTLLDGSAINVNHFIGLSPASLNVNKGTISVEESWTSDATKLSITSVDATLITDGNSVTMQAPDMIWAGTLINKASLLLLGSITMDSLVADYGSTLNLNNNNTLNVQVGLSLLGKPGALASITSDGTASINANFHKKICADFVSITNVSLLGNAIINVGSNSVLQNAPGWLNQTCDDVLFPEFEVRYACVDAFAEFINKSTGNNITSTQWNFGDLNSDNNVSDLISPLHQFSESGQYTVTLTIFSGATSRSFSRELDIIANTLPETTIESNSEVLFSSIEAAQYQWYNNGLKLPGETNRVYAYSGNEGLYQVALIDAQCNRLSSVFSISGFEESQELLQVYPNPTSERVYFAISDIEQVIVKDILGRSITVSWNASQKWVDLSTAGTGMYLLNLKKQGKEFTRRVWVQK